MSSKKTNPFLFNLKKVLIPISLLLIIIFLVNYNDGPAENNLNVQKVITNRSAANTQNSIKSNRKVASKPRVRRMRQRTTTNQQALINRAKKTYKKVINDPTPQEDFLYDQEDKSRNEKNPLENKEGISASNILPKFSEQNLDIKNEDNSNTVNESVIETPRSTLSEASNEPSQEMKQAFVDNNIKSENTEEKDNSKTSSSVNFAPNISADKTTISIEEEKTGTINVSANDPENIYIDFTHKNLPSFVNTNRIGNKLELAINPIFGDKGIYSFQIIAIDDQGLTKAIDLEIIIDSYVLNISKIELVNSATDAILGDLNDGQVIDLYIVGDKLNILAKAPFAGSVKFESSDFFTQTENEVPFSYRGNIGNDFSDWTPTVGPLSITITPYELIAEGGVIGTPYIINLSIIDSTP